MEPSSCNEIIIAPSNARHVRRIAAIAIIIITDDIVIFVAVFDRWSGHHVDDVDFVILQKV